MSDFKDLIENADLYDGKNYEFVQNRFGKLKSAIHFKQGYLKIPQGIYFDCDFTITAWLKLNNNSFKFNNIMSFMTNNTENQINIGVKANWPNKNCFNYNVWYHFAYVWNYASVEPSRFFHMNGVIVYNDSIIYSPTKVQRTRNFIGKPINSEANVDVILSDLKIYKGVLTFDEILNEYLQTK